MASPEGPVLRHPENREIPNPELSGLRKRQDGKGAEEVGSSFLVRSRDG
jgi:hypothetical protein